MGKKATNAIAEERINAIFKMLLEAYSRRQIIQYAAEHWKINESQVDKYIRKARDYIMQDAAIERSEWLTEALASLKDIQRQAISAGQYSSAAKACELQARLLRFEV